MPATRVYSRRSYPGRGCARNPRIPGSRICLDPGYSRAPSTHGPIVRDKSYDKPLSACPVRPGVQHSPQISSSSNAGKICADRKLRASRQCLVRCLKLLGTTAASGGCCLVLNRRGNLNRHLCFEVSYIFGRLKTQVAKVE